VLANITGFQPYFYVALPRGFTTDDISPFRDYLNVGLVSMPFACEFGLDFSLQNHLDEGNPVISIEQVSKKSLWGYLGDDWVPFLKITLTDPKSVPKVRDKFLRVNYPCALRLIAIVLLRLFDRGECEFRGLFEGITATYESNIVFTLRFMIDSKVDCILNNDLNMPYFISSGCWHELD